MLIRNKADFAVLETTVTPEDMTISPDLLPLPLVAEAAVPAINVEGLSTTTKVVLSPAVLVAMLMGNITTCVPWLPACSSPC